MSLDVYLNGFVDVCPECGHRRRRPVEVFSWNITHNLSKMASEAGLYDVLWQPDESGYEHAKQLIEPLRNGLKKLELEPDRFKAFNPLNGWGDYESLVKFVRAYLVACEDNPDATVRVSR